MSWEISLAMWIDQIQMFTALLPARKHTLALHTSVYRAHRRILPSQTPWCTCMLPWKAFPVWLTAVMEVKISLINWEDGWEWSALVASHATTQAICQHCWTTFIWLRPRSLFCKVLFCHSWKIAFLDQLWHSALKLLGFFSFGWGVLFGIRSCLFS